MSQIGEGKQELARRASGAGVRSACELLAAGPIASEVRSFFAPRDQRRGVARVDRSAKKGRDFAACLLHRGPGPHTPTASNGKAKSSLTGTIIRDDRQ